MDYTDSRTNSIYDTFDEVESFVNAQPTSIIANRYPILVAIEAWKRDARETPERLRPLLDLSTIPSLAAVRHSHDHGAGFFLPIISAWAVLGIAEMQYRSAGSRESFFVWWSRQAFGPAVYSFVIAFLLLVVVGFHIYRDSDARKADQVETALAEFAATLSIQAARVMEDAKPLDSAASVLKNAANHLNSVSSSFSTSQRDIQDYLGAVQTAGEAVSKLDEVTVRLAEQVESLTKTIDSTSGLVDAFDKELSPVHETLDILATLSRENQVRSAELSEQIGKLLGLMLQAVDVANKSNLTAQEASRSLPELASASSILASAVSTLNTSQAQAQDLIDSAQRVVAFLDDRIVGKGILHDWPPTIDSRQTAE